MSRRRSRVMEAPAALSSDGSVLVNANQLGVGSTLAEIVAHAEATGLPIFVGVALPARGVRPILRAIDDAAADVVGRLAYRFIAASHGSASGLSSAARVSSRRDRFSRPARRQRGRRL